MMDLVGTEPTISSMPTARLGETPKKDALRGFHGRLTLSKNFEGLVDLVGIEPTTFPASRDALSLAALTLESIPRSMESVACLGSITILVISGMSASFKSGRSAPRTRGHQVWCPIR